MHVEYEAPSPSGRNVVLLSGGVHSYVNVSGVTTGVIVITSP